METPSLNGVYVGSVSENWDACSYMLEQHWQEVCTNTELMKLDPDKDRFIMLEKAGLLVSLFAYDQGKHVGYSVNIVTPHLHYKRMTMAMNDVLFLDKEYRNSRLGLTLIKRTEIECAKAGAHVLMWHAKSDTPLANILPRLDYKLQDLIYMKEL